MDRSPGSGGVERLQGLNQTAGLPMRKVLAEPMFRTRDRSLSCDSLRLTALCIFISLFGMCRDGKISRRQQSFPGHREKESRADRFPVARGGASSAGWRWYQLGREIRSRILLGASSIWGSNAISAANPGETYGFLRPESVSCCP